MTRCCLLLISGSSAKVTMRRTGNLRFNYPESLFQFPVFLWVCLAASLTHGSSPQEGKPLTGPNDNVHFNRDIRPLISDRCFQCHGPDENARESDLRLDQRDLAKKQLQGSSLEEIKLWQRINSDDPDFMMPPPNSKLSLSSDEKQLIGKWLLADSPYEKHWSFLKPGKVPLPPVEHLDWCRNEIDRFVLQKLETLGVKPNRPASKERLIRRLTFDLLGLPPTDQEVDHFLADESPDAYEKLVDGLLAREGLGERLTSQWLDVARYSDSFGYQVDRGRHVWPWRDWVVKSFNSNLPYDQFIIHQLAGDMLPNATDQQILATAFNRLHPQKVEGGSVPEEFRVEYVADRNHTFATAFLGLTIECARCHDHKFDPITQSEYYQLFSYFNNIDEAGLYSYFTNSTPTPTLLMSSGDQKQKLALLESTIQAKETELAALEIDATAFSNWFTQKENIQPSAPIEYRNFEDFKGGANLSVMGPVGKGVQLSGDDAIALKTGNFTRNQPFSFGFWMNTADKKDRAVVFHRSRAWTDAASRGYQLLIEDGKLSFSLIHFWPGNAIRIRSRKEIPLKKWIHVSVTYDGSSRASGLKLFLDGQALTSEVIRDHLYKNITGGGGNNIAIGERFRDRGFTDGKIDEFKVFDRELSGLEIENLVKTDSFQKAKKIHLADLPDRLKNKWQEFFQIHVSSTHLEIRKQLGVLRKQRSQQVDGIVEIMVMNDRKQRRPTYRLHRGSYQQPKEEVFPGIPAVFSSKQIPKNRLELARWLVGPENPLTSLVTVNRYWQMLFGDGLVRTPEDFGSQGQPPTHPELLDWIATDFADNNWNLKRLLKQLVMSATYQQDSILTPDLIERDPQNTWLARASSYRLPAEMLRDNALAISGLLSPRQGGGGAKPYDLALSFKPLGPDKGEGLYRRSVYTYWKRTGPSPVMMTLDAAKREICTVKRERTATPLQAFVLLNDPQFVEAARVLAEELIQKHPQDPITIAFRRSTSRYPDAKEKKILTTLLRTQKKYFSENLEAAKKFVSVGGRPFNSQLDPAAVAALATVIQTVMNFDECIMRR
ncbi:DUF1553 domain-containing protein [Mariniblastus sp.]|nr:DUF1553 domain-containing protein [Mariniblastus sp.]MDB4756659.1 DUF1553 domain-containing protein [Mariniblastus sp.]